MRRVQRPVCTKRALPKRDATRYRYIVYNLQGGIDMDGKRLTGMAIAATAAALFVSGCANTGGSNTGSTTAKVQCEGVNACKGMSDCKTANSSCKAQNACKGQGFVTLTAGECQKISGRA
jgi:hypothetical protein